MTELKDHFECRLMSEWASIHHRFQTITGLDGEPIDPKTIQNTHDFLRLAESRCRVPTGIAKGHWPTIRIWWDQIEFEIFPDSIEVYRFLRGRTLIAELGHQAGTPFSEELVAQLPTAFPIDV